MGNSKNEILDSFVLVLTLILTIVSCNNPVDNKETVSKAEAGEDQETYVGSYVIFDPTKSTLAEGDVPELIEYVQDTNNPDELLRIFQASLTDKYIMAFKKEGNNSWYKPFLKNDRRSMISWFLIIIGLHLPKKSRDKARLVPTIKNYKNFPLSSGVGILQNSFFPNKL